MSNRRLTLWVAGWVCALACVSLLGTASAGAAMIFPSVGQISAPAPGFGVLDEGSVAVDDFNGHILVADSHSGLIYDFTSASDTKPTVWDGSNTPSKSFGEERVSVAVDNTSGDVYVADTTHMVIDKFDASGVLISTFGDSSPTPNGQLAGTVTPAHSFSHPGTETPLGIAVDQATHDLYLIDSGHEVIDVFSAEGVFIPGKQIVEKPFGLYTCEGKYTDGIAVEATTDNVFVSDSCLVQTYEFDALGSYVTTFEGTNTPAKSFGTGRTSVAVDDANGRVFISDTDGVVDVFESSGEYIGQIAGDVNKQYRGVAIDQSTGEAYVSDNAKKVVSLFGTGIIVPDVSTSAASSLQLTGATLNGTVNPDGAGKATCRFVWGPPGELGHVSACAAEVPEGSIPVGVHADISGLERDSEYCFRLQATNANGPNAGEASQDRCFTTLGPGLDKETVSDVTSESATLQASIDPNDAPTTYRFEYGTSASYDSSTVDIAVGAGKGDVEVSNHIQGLAVGTVYHYRVVVTSELSPGHFETFEGPDQTFTSQTIGDTALLPDGRQWELVSPPNKQGASVEPLFSEKIIASSADGEALTYVASAPTELEPQGNSRSVEVFAGRGSDGWLSRDIQIPHEKAVGASVGAGLEYRFFSEDLQLAVAEPVGAFPQPGSPNALSSEASEQTPYLRTTYLNGNVSEQCVPLSEKCYSPLVTGAEGVSDVPHGTVFGRQGAGVEGPTFIGASHNAKHVILESGVPLTATSIGHINGLYEWSADRPADERLQLVGVLPGPSGEPVEAALGTMEGNAKNRRGAVSEDGSRVFWRYTNKQEETTHLYMRDTVREETIQLDVLRGGTGNGKSLPLFQLANRDGSRVWFTDKQMLTSASGEGDLYECEIVEEAGKPACSLKDLTPMSSGVSAEVQGAVLGASNDGSLVYFVADGALTGNEENANDEKALNGQPNLYVRQAGTTKFITVFSPKDSPSWGIVPGGALAGMTARVSPNGRWLAFMSQRSLTGYDSRDVRSGEADVEVFLYNADSNRLVCASCNPSGGRPTGAEYGTLVRGLGEQGGWSLSDWLAASVPGWSAYNGNDALYQSRYLSDSGRLFFNSTDALVPRDVDGAEDVYEYEPPGVGTCTTASLAFAARSGGCVSLISSGDSPFGSDFLDASEDGGHVFFLTVTKLASQDFDSATDVYDAYECTSSVPCFPKPAAIPPPCDTGDACKPSPTPQPAIFGSPSSATFTGVGNVSLVPSVPVVKHKILTRKQRLARALKLCAKKSKRKRRACDERAQRAYATAGKAAKSRQGGK